VRAVPVIGAPPASLDAESTSKAADRFDETK